MPYPLTELPYGIRRRISELATEAERFVLQIAANDDYICPTTMQTIYDIGTGTFYPAENGQELTIYRNFGLIWETETVILDPGEDALLSVDILIVYNNINLDLITTKVTHNLLLRPFCMFLQDYESSFLKKLASKICTSYVTHLNLHSSQTVNFADLYAAVPNFTWLIMEKVDLPKFWMADILNNQNKKLSRFEYCCVDFLGHVLFKWDIEEFVEFFEAQQPNFVFQIACYGGHRLQLMQQFFNLRFRLTDKEPTDKRFVQIHITGIQNLYYILSDDSCVSNLVQSNVKSDRCSFFM